MLMVLAAVAMQVAQPSAEAIALGRQVAENGTLGSLLPLLAQRDVEELISSNPSLTAVQQAQLRTTGTRIAVAGIDRLLTANGRALAERLTIEQLREVVAFDSTPAAEALRAATPAAIVATMTTIGDLDLKRDIRAAFCRESGQLCETR